MSRSHDSDYAIGAITNSVSGGLTLDFDVDVMGNITASSDAVNQATPDRTYVHDRLSRLGKVFEGSPTRVPLEAYTYSKTGDRLSASASGTATAYAYAPGTHHLASVGGVARSHDANGNLLSLSDTPYPLVYDDRNRLAQAKYDGPGGYALYTYAYNGKGERVAKQTPDRRATSAYDEAGHLLSVYTTSAGGGGSLVGPSFPLWDEVIYLDNLPIGIARDGVLYYIEPDHLGTPRQVVDRSSNVAIWKWSLLGNTFGANAPDEDPDGNGNAFEMNLRFPGQYYDAETGLNYNYFRDYEAATGRYIQSDPIGTYGGFATYSYSAQNPTASFDRYGLCWSNARAVAHFYAGGGDVSTDTIGCTTQLTDRIDPARSAWEALTRSAAESKARAIKCGTSSTFKNNRSVAVSSGIFWIGGFSLLQDANCVVSKTCGSNGEIACTPDSYSYDCLLAHKMHDLFVNPTDFDNSNSDFWDNWNYGGSPFYVDGFWDDRISGGGVLL